MENREVYIEGFENRYIVNELGEFFSMYKMSKNKTRKYNRKKLSVYYNDKKNKTSVVVNLHKGGKTRAYLVKTIMRNHFQIEPPDKYHRYVLICKNGDNLDMSLKNLKYVLYLEKDYLFDVVINYNDLGEIVSKVCGECGEKKNINCFQLQKKHQTYRNQCIDCRVKQNKERRNKTPESLKKHNASQMNYYFKNHKKMRSYHNDYANKARAALSNYYVRKLLKSKGVFVENLTEEDFQTHKYMIAITRFFKKLSNDGHQNKQTLKDVEHLINSL